MPMERPRTRAARQSGRSTGADAARSARMLLEAEALERLRPLRRPKAHARGALEVENRTDTRAIVIAQGVALGWVDAGQTLRVEAFCPATTASARSAARHAAHAAASSCPCRAPSSWAAPQLSEN